MIWQVFTQRIYCVIYNIYFEHVHHHHHQTENLLTTNKTTREAIPTSFFVQHATP